VSPIWAARASFPAAAYLIGDALGGYGVLALALYVGMQLADVRGSQQ